MALLSKINIGGTVYDIKDAAARAAIEQLTGGVDSLGTASELNYAEAVANDKTLPTGAAVIKYVGEQIADINAFAYEVVTELPAPSADTMFTIYLVADAQGAAPDAYEEWITIKTGDTYTFEKIGDTNIGLNGYVPTARTVAGLALSNDITVEALQAALGLGALAYKNTISATVECVTAVGDIDYTPAGKVDVALKYADTDVASTGKYTPAGNVSGTTTAAGTVEVALDQTATQATLTKADYTPAGTVSVNLSGNTFNAITGVGTQASFTEGEFTPASLTHAESKFAVEGIVASMNEAEETLTLSAAGKADASLISAFSGGAKAADTFVPNSVATMKEQTVGVQTATFAGTKAEQILVSGVAYDKATVSGATFTGKEAEINATFAGTEGDLNVSGKYAKADVDAASFTGTQETLQHNATKATVPVTVTIA
jgi:hypothetical protein